MLISPLDPQPSLNGGEYKPSNAVAAPVVNAVDAMGSQPYANGRAAPQPRGNVDWVGMARNAYESSESWLQINQRAIWARAFAHYRNDHSPDSPILAEANKHRAKHFWPKTRTLVRAIQAAGASAYFASSDVVALEAEDADDPNQVAATELMKALVNYRLTHTIPWYLIVLGGLAEASVTGTVASHQSWEYKENGKIDRPNVRIVPVENIRLSPAADWLDPANSSPYLIELIPMYVGDVLSKIAEGKTSKAGEPAWYNLGESALLAAGNRDNLDTTRRARSGSQRLDPKSNMVESQNEFRVIWVHRNIIRHNGTDWLYYTAGANTMLSDPVPLAQVIPWADGKRDYVLGKLEVETDRPYPAGPVELAGGMQKALNELKNQRFDNVRQVLNRRYLYRAGQQVDVRALGRNVPGGLIGISAPGSLDQHVQPLPVQDVTGSAYQEEDRLTMAFDDLTGSTNAGTVNANRRLHETATGMNLMAEAGNQVREMELRTFTETWMEPVLRQIVQLEAKYETDTIALTVAAKKAGLRRILSAYFNYKFSVSVNVGMGAVSPTQRMQRIQGAVSTVVGLVPDAAQAIKGPEIAKEVFGAAGFDNGNRFFDFAKVEQMKANPEADPQLELAKAQLEQRNAIEQGKLELAQAKLQLENQRLEMENAKTQGQLRKLEEEINKLIADTTTQNVTAVFEATQAAGVIAQNPGIAPTTDEILASAGFLDHNKAPVATEVQPPVAEVVPPEIQNTHPGFPPNPPAAAGGILRGLRTPELET